MAKNLQLYLHVLQLRHAQIQHGLDALVSEILACIRHPAFFFKKKTILYETKKQNDSSYSN